MARNIFSITLGEDITGDKFDLMCRENEASTKFILKNVKYHEAILECMESLIATAQTKMMNPLQMLGLIKDLSWNFTTFQNQVTKNCQTLRDQVRQYVIARRSGEKSSKVKD